MCVVSMVHDHYNPLIPPATNLPYIIPNQDPAAAKPLQPDWSQVFRPSSQDIETAVKELRQLIEDFRTALAAAKIVDKLTGQPDCLDPAKAGLEARVAALELALDAHRKASKKPTKKKACKKQVRK